MSFTCCRLRKINVYFVGLKAAIIWNISAFVITIIVILATNNHKQPYVVLQLADIPRN